MQQLSFTCPLPPSVNSYLGKRVVYNPITHKPYVQVYETKEAKAFKKHMVKVLQRAMKEQCWSKTSEHQYVVCEIEVYLNQKRRDTDNLFKCLLDTLTENGLVYDDSMVIPRVMNIYIDSENPRVEVVLRESIKKGVFVNHEHLYNFERANCLNCNRLSRNCSIRREAIENKIRKEIDTDNNVCSAIKIRKG